MERPFGFPFLSILQDVYAKSELLDESHGLDNPVQGFDARGAPIFKYPEGKLDVVLEYGNRVQIMHRDRIKTVATAALHTPHTISLQKVAFVILQRLRKQPHVRWDSDGSTFYDVKLTNRLPIQSHHNRMELWLDARHCGHRVVLKTTKNPAYMLRYILEAVIQTLVFRQCPKDVPEPFMVGLTADQRLVVCSEQITIPAVTQMIRHAPSYADLLQMSQHFCEMILRIQSAGCTHRDAHTSNVYVDPKTLQTRLIDFDWAAIRWCEFTLSIPRHLYDSTREIYGRNRSVDCCIFFRSLQTQMVGMTHPDIVRFKTNILTPIMQRYEDECRSTLSNASDTVSQQLYRIASSTETIRGEYAHANGLKRMFTDFDYEMGYYEWKSMRPEVILKYLKTC